LKTNLVHSICEKATGGNHSDYPVTHHEYRDGVGPSPNGVAGGGAEPARPRLNPPLAYHME